MKFLNDKKLTIRSNSSKYSINDIKSITSINTYMLRLRLHGKKKYI